MVAFLPLLLLLVTDNAGLLVAPSLGLNQDGFYLLDAKHAFTGSALTDRDPRDATPCGWTSVSCVDGALTEVSLPNTNFKGSFPSDIAAKAVAGFKALVRLDLYMNTLAGVLTGHAGHED